MLRGKKNKSAYIPHNSAKLIRGGREYFTLLPKLIGEAQHTVHLQVYIYEDDETGRAVGHALMEAAKRGVRVYLLADGYASKELSAAFIKELQTARRFLPFLRTIIKKRAFLFWPPHAPKGFGG